jgi:hypothetical protein
MLTLSVIPSSLKKVGGLGMPDDLSKRGPWDRTRVNVNEPWEVKWRCMKFGCSELELRDAVDVVGVMADLVEERLRLQGHLRGKGGFGF